MATFANKGMRVSGRGIAAAGLVLAFFALVARLLHTDLGYVAAQHPPRIWAYWLHIAGGVVALSVAPFQFIAPIRNRFRLYHRVAGYVFVAGSLTAFAGFWLLVPTAGDALFGSQVTAITLWMLALAAAIVAARRKRFLTHQHNMTRAFVLASYFVIVRLVGEFGSGSLGPLLTADKSAQAAHLDWLSWVVPLACVEAYYTVKWDALIGGRR